MRKILGLLFLSLGFYGASFGQTKITPNEYINKYKDYAVIEMHRSGVPASITLSQGMLESSNGNSRLATKAMNHFGIKCKSSWTGGVIYADDDAPDECFRAYKSVLESYKDHSDFLRDNWRYHALFELDPTDYKGWAKGLRQAGYATNKQYHTLLISLIERYELYKYDLMPVPQKNDALISNNKVPAIYAPKNSSAKKIADEHHLKAKHIYKYNDLEKGTEINEGDLIYLKPKRRKGSVPSHTVGEGESMYMIAQTYGIKLKHLYKKNRMEQGTEAKPGETLNLQKKRNPADEVKTRNEQEMAALEIIKDNFVNPNSIEIEKAAPIEKADIEVPEFHIVVKGDNIYRISEKYHVLEEGIIKWNGLTSMQVTVGQKLYLHERKGAEAPEKIIVNETEEVVEIVEEENIISTETESDDESSKFHVVQAGETLYRICKKYDVSQDDIMRWNDMATTTIYEGQRLRIAE